MGAPTNRNRHEISSKQRSFMDQLKRQTGQISAINAVTVAVSQSLDLNATLQTALEAVLSVIPVEASGISLVDERAGELVLRAQRGWLQDFVTQPMRIKLGTGMSGKAVMNDEIVVTGDVTDDPRLIVPDVVKERFKAMVLAPMHARGRVVGILSVMSRAPYKFETHEVTVIQAIADQVGLALDNARLYEEVREQRSRLEAVLQSTADAIIATNNHGIINLVNHAAETLFQLESESLLGLHLLHVPFSPELTKKLNNILDPNVPDGQTFEIVTENERSLAVVVSRVYSQTHLDENEAEGWVVVFQDITHMKEAERSRLQFIQTAAHDLRNPLGVTLSAITMLNKQYKTQTPTEKEIFNIAMNGINRMQELIDDLLNLEHIESGIDFRYEPMNLAELLERCAIDMGPQFTRREQVFSLTVPPHIPTFNGDERWLYRAVLNLLSNANKYTPTGGKIALRTEMHENEVVIQVEDDGPGIALEAQAHLFERFYRVRRTEEKVHGTGLGLAIVKSVVEKHGGRVFVQSEMNRGSSFGIVLPLPAPVTT